MTKPVAADGEPCIISYALKPIIDVQTREIRGFRDNEFVVRIMRGGLLYQVVYRVDGVIALRQTVYKSDEEQTGETL